MSKRASWIALSTSIAMASAAAVAGAEPTGAQTVNTPVVAAANRTITVNEPFARRVADGCTYSGSLQGRVEVRRGMFTGERFRPRLSISGTFRCADRVQQLPSQPYRAGWMTAGDLERGVETAGRISIQHGSRMCTVAPRVALLHAHLVAQSVFTSSCEPARGGGPLHGQ